MRKFYDALVEALNDAIAIAQGEDTRAARAVGDLRKVMLPGGEKEWEVLAIGYPEGSTQNPTRRP